MELLPFGDEIISDMTGMCEVAIVTSVVVQFKCGGWSCSKKIEINVAENGSKYQWKEIATFQIVR